MTVIKAGLAPGTPSGRTYLTYTTDDDGVHVMCRDCPGWDVVLSESWGDGLCGAPVRLAFSVALQHVQATHGTEAL